MKSILLLIFAGVLIISCGKSNKTPDNQSEPQSVAAQAKKKKNSALRVGGGLFNTQGLPIEGSFYVGRGATHDTLIGDVTNWQGLWWDYHYNYAPPVYQIVPGGQGATNYGAQASTPHTFPFIVIVSHGGVERSYFFGVSSSEGHNVAGKTVTVN